jgi:hypothetical protein
MSEAKVSAYTIYPTGYDDATFADKHDWTITVEDGGSEYGWAVRKSARRCLNRDGEWEHEHIPSERSDEWLAEHRFPEAEAIERAKAAVDEIRVKGMTIAEADAYVAQRTARLEEQ